ncbi:MAG TPA: class I SAM-dependent methyltransferase [Chitinophagaceae bacterium]|jgi:ubiquinone/menaquinone biosynthesis C-methylase UbiE|nr:class I SAM-dependent methyltransferase [Chitinophagaceae bacterium]
MSQQNIIDCYNKTATNYAEKFGHELEHKHLDLILLKAFAAENGDKGKLIDLGCGPGQTKKFMAGCGIKDILGADLSPEMIKVAKDLHPQLDFETADMLKLRYPDNHFGSAIAFYSIVHFDDAQLETAFKEIRRVLKKGGQFLFSYHIGDKPVHLDEFLDQPVDIDFNFFQPKKIGVLLAAAGFEILDATEREPYPEEYPSRRAYIWVMVPDVSKSV